MVQIIVINSEIKENNIIKLNIHNTVIKFKNYIVRYLHKI